MYREEALVLLRWLAYARTPPTLSELAEASIVDPAGQGVVDISNRGGLEDVLEILSGLVTCGKAEDGDGDDDAIDYVGDDYEGDD